MLFGLRLIGTRKQVMAKVEIAVKTVFSSVSLPAGES